MPNARRVGLAGLPDRFGPGGVSAWAKKREVDAYYVDNCWIHVPVTLDQLVAFLRDTGAACPELSAFSEPDFQQMLIMDADEF